MSDNLNLVRRPNDVLVYPYDPTISTAAANWGRGGAGTFEEVSIGHDWRIRQAGEVSYAVIRISSVLNLTSMKIKIWRSEGDLYRLVGVTRDLMPQITINGVGTQTLRFDPIEVEEGDYVGRLFTSSGNCYPYTARTGLGATIHAHYRLDGVEGTTDVDIENWAEDSSGVVTPTLLYDQSPGVVGIGDSLIAGANSHASYCQTASTTNAPRGSISALVASALGVPHQNMGIGSEETTAIEARFAADAVAWYPRIAIINGGLNDIANIAAPEDEPTDRATFITKWTSMLDQCVAAGIIPVVCKLMSWTAGTDTEMGYRDVWNAELVVLAASYPTAVVVDFDSYIGTGTNNWDIQVPLTDDGTHLRPHGYAICADAILDALLPVLARLDSVKTRGFSITI